MGRGSWKEGWDVECFSLIIFFSLTVFGTVNAKHSNITLTVALFAMKEMYHSVQHSSH